VQRNIPELWPNDWILHYDNASAHKALSVKQFLAQKSITEMGYPPCSPDLALNDFLLFPKIKSALKGKRFLYTENIPPPPTKKGDNSTESYSITGVPEIFLTVTASFS
jgi:transposase